MLANTDAYTVKSTSINIVQHVNAVVLDSDTWIRKTLTRLRSPCTLADVISTTARPFLLGTRWMIRSSPARGQRDLGTVPRV